MYYLYYMMVTLKNDSSPKHTIRGRHRSVAVGYALIVAALIIFVVGCPDDNSGPASALTFNVTDAPGAQVYVQHRPISLQLPAARGGNPPLSHELFIGESDEPTVEFAGLTFDPETRIISGVPTTAATGDNPIRLRYSAFDVDRDPSIPAFFEFTIEITPNNLPEFDAEKIENFATEYNYQASTGDRSVELPNSSSTDGQTEHVLTQTDGNPIPNWLTFAANTRILTVGTTILPAVRALPIPHRRLITLINQLPAKKIVSP